MKYLLPALTALVLLIASGCGEEESLPSGSGMIEATEVTVSAQVAGPVERLFFDEGTVVATGDTLAIIDTTKLALELASARAGREVVLTRLDAARLRLQEAQETEAYLQKEVNRIEKLVGANTATQRQLDDIRHRYTQAQIGVSSARSAIESTQAELAKIDADMARLQNQLEDASPTAPVSGTVTEKYVNVGELLSPGRPIARIAQLDTMWVRIYLPAQDFAEVIIGDTATVDTEAGTTYSGTVTWVANEAEFTPKNVQTKKARADLVYAIEVTVPNPEQKLKIGQPVFVTIGE